MDIESTQAAIKLLKAHNGGTTDVGDMIVYRAIGRLEGQLREHLTGHK